jgi:protein-S-isoprenylcysteine O-methyltransferase Ste14
MMRFLRAKIPPPIVAMGTGALMWLASKAAPAWASAFSGGRIAALCLAGLGVMCAVMGVTSFRRAHTTLNPTTPDKASSLVTTGIFGRTRNPMYLGLLLVLTGWAVYLSNGIAFVFLPGFVLYMTFFQIRPEEEAMGKLFGGEFEAYRSRVRRWI